MKAVIPCALKEESLFPLVESKPTALMPLMGKPVVKHLIRDLQNVGVDDIYLVTNYMEDKIQEEFEEYTNVNVVTQDKLNGTGGAVEQCDFIDEEFLVVNGDVAVSGRDIERLLDKHEEKDSKLTVLADMESKPEKFGVLSIENDKIVNISEKPEEAENPMINTGIYVFDPEIFDYLGSMEDEKDLIDAVQQMLQEESCHFELVKDYWIDIGSPKKLWKADQTKREYSLTETEISDQADIADNVNIEGKAVIEKNAELKPGTVIEGKVFIGEGAVVGPNTVLKDCSICKRSQLRSSDVESALLFEENIIDPFVHLEQVVLGEECDVKSNTTVRESFIGPRSFIEMNNSIRGVKFVPDARTDLGEISK